MSDGPQTGDSILAEGKDERFHAKLDLGRWDVYRTAYLYGAERVVGSIDTGANADLIAYPALYLYRHYLELMLKRLIALGCALESKRCAKTNSHRLDEPWSEARQLIARHAFRAGESQRELEIAGGVIAEFSRLDPSGEAFRYSEYKDGKETLTGDENVCLDEVVRVMKRIDNFFVGVECVLERQSQYQENHSDPLLTRGE